MPLTLAPSSSGPRRMQVVANIPVDLVMRVPALPAAGEDVRAESVMTRPGGGFNALYAAARAGLAVSYAGAHGVGVYGDLVRAALATLGCALVQPRMVDRDTGLVLALVDARGERTFVSSPDAVVPYTAAMLSRVRVSQRDLVYVGGYGLGLGEPGQALADWVAQLPAESLAFCDLGPWGAKAGPGILGQVLGRVDWLSCNAQEAALLTGYGEPGTACAALHRRTGGGVLVRAGRDGCWLSMPGGKPALVPAPAAGEVVDTNGAGDTHSGYFLAGLAEGMAPLDAVRLANAAAALSVTRPGPATAPPRRELGGGRDG